MLSINEKAVNVIAKFITFLSWILFFLLAFNMLHYLSLYALKPIPIWAFVKSIFNIGLTETEISATNFSNITLLLNQLSNFILNSFFFAGVFIMIYEVYSLGNVELSKVVRLFFSANNLKHIMKKTKWLLGLLAVVSVLGIFHFSCSGTSEEEEVYVWGGPKNLEFLPIIAQEKGFFKENKIQTKRNDVQTGKMAMDALQTGDIDFGILVETNISFYNFGEGKPLKVIAIIQQKQDDALVYNSSKISTPKDLVGKKIGITPATTSQSFVIKYLKSKGINIDSCTFINMAPPAIQAGLINKTLDAGSIWQPFRYNVFKSDSKHLMKEFNSEGVYNGFALLVVTEEFADTHKIVIERFLKSLIASEKYIKENTNEAQMILSQQIDIPLDVLKGIWGEYIAEVEIDQSALLNAFNSDVDWIRQYVPEFKNKKVPSFDNVVMPVFLKELDVERVK